jgi:hypothetical protein
MDILDPENITGSQDCAGIMRLENIFKNQGDMPGPLVNDRLKFLPLIFRNELIKIKQKLLLFGRVYGWFLFHDPTPRSFPNVKKMKRYAV